MGRPPGRPWPEEAKRATRSNLREYCLRRYKDTFGLPWREVNVAKLLGDDAPVDDGMDDTERVYRQRIGTALESLRQTIEHYNVAMARARELEAEAVAALDDDDGVALHAAGVPYLSAILDACPALPSIAPREEDDHARILAGAELVSNGRPVEDMHLAWLGILCRVTFKIQPGDKVRDVVRRESNRYASRRARHRRRQG